QPLADIGTWAQFEPVLRIDECLLPTSHLDRVGLRIERGELVDVLDRWQIQLIPQAQVQGQFLRDLPVVLEIVAGAEGLCVVKRLAQVAISQKWRAEQQVGNRVAGESTIEPVTSAAERREE